MIFFRVLFLWISVLLKSEFCITNLCTNSINLGPLLVDRIEGGYKIDLGVELRNRFGLGIFIGSYSTDCENASLVGEVFTYSGVSNCSVVIDKISYPGSRSPDIDGNGIVDDSDLLSILFKFGESNLCAKEDIDYSGVIDDGDLLAVIFCFGRTGGECISSRTESCQITIPLTGIECDDIDFTQFTRTSDYNSRYIKVLGQEILNLLGESRLARKSRRFRLDLEKTRQELQGIFVETWRLLWQTFPSNISQCTTNSGAILSQCVQTDLTGIYAPIIRKNRAMVFVIESLISKYERYLKRSRRIDTRLQILLNRMRNNFNQSVNYLNSLPRTSVSCPF